MATFKNLVRLNLSWSVSRGRDTAGYNIAKLYNTTTRKAYRTCGGGYDMVGTVFGEFLNDQYPAALQSLFTHGADVDAGYRVPGYRKLPSLYGVTLSPKNIAHCDGGCGIQSMLSIAEQIGLGVERTYNKKGRVDGFMVWEL